MKPTNPSERSLFPAAVSIALFFSLEFSLYLCLYHFNSHSVLLSIFSRIPSIFAAAQSDLIFGGVIFRELVDLRCSIVFLVRFQPTKQKIL